MTIRIFTSYHARPVEEASADLFVPLWTGGEAEPARGIISDMDGDNIHHRIGFGDMRAQFHVWRERMAGCDYVGFEQYRRRLLLDPLSSREAGGPSSPLFRMRRCIETDYRKLFYAASPDEFAAFLDQRDRLGADQIARLKSWITSFDIVTVRPYVERGLAEQWHAHASSAVWTLVIDSIRSSNYWRDIDYLLEENHARCHFHNMYVLRANLFDEYMRMWAEIIFRLDLPDDIENRWYGVISERLFSIWLMKQRLDDPLLRIGEVPFVFTDDYEAAIESYREVRP